MEISWIKLKTDMFSDEKIEFIESLPEGDSIIVIWLKLLALAGKCNAGGFIMLSENIPFTEEMLVRKFGKSHMVVKLALETLTKLNMIESLENRIYITNWEKHQNIEKLSSIKEYNRERQRKYREKKRYLLGTTEVVTDNVCDSHSDSNGDMSVTVASIDIKNKNKKKIYNHQFEDFWKLYPRKMGKQDALKTFTSLLQQGESFETIMSCTENYIKELQSNRTEEKYIKHATTFLRSNRYLDYLSVNNGKERMSNRGITQLPEVTMNEKERELLEQVYQKRGIHKE